ncbi:MAG TPA: hypothetical protein VMW95_09545 [Desulfobacterales bacterium]|nr:hypothetical protein [Desulfobacterales bacterium]
MAENTVTSKDAERQEVDEDLTKTVVVDVGAALDMLYGCRSNIEVSIQLFRLKNKEEEENYKPDSDDDFKKHAFFEGLEWSAQALHGKINEVIELLYGVEVIAQGSMKGVQHG